MRASIKTFCAKILLTIACLSIVGFAGCTYAPTKGITNGLEADIDYQYKPYQNHHYVVNKYTVEVPTNTWFLIKDKIFNPNNLICAYKITKPRLVRERNTDKKFKGSLAAIDYEWHLLKSNYAGEPNNIISSGKETIYDGTAYETVFHDITIIKDYYRMSACRPDNAKKYSLTEWYFPTTIYIGSGNFNEENHPNDSKFRSITSIDNMVRVSIAPTPWSNIKQVNLLSPNIIWYEKDMQREVKTINLDEFKQ
jgi:hypothetical protein